MANPEDAQKYVDLDDLMSELGSAATYTKGCLNIREYQVAEEVFYMIRDKIKRLQTQTRDDIVGESEWLPTHPTLNSAQCKECGAIHEIELPRCPYCGRKMVDKENTK